MGHNLFQQVGANAVDHLLGPAYDTIKRVSDKLNELMLLHDNLDAVQMAANNIRQNILVVEETIPPASPVLFIQLPVGIPQTDLFDYKTLLVDVNGVIYNSDSNVFTDRVINDTVEIELDISAPAELVGGTAKVTIFYHNRNLEE